MCVFPVTHYYHNELGVCGMGSSTVMTTYSAQETSLGSLQVISAIHTRQAGLNWPERSSRFLSLQLHERDRVLRLAACSENSSCFFFVLFFAPPCSVPSCCGAQQPELIQAGIWTRAPMLLSPSVFFDLRSIYKVGPPHRGDIYPD